MTCDRLLRGQKVRLTALNDDDAATIARWHEDAQFLRLYDTQPAHPRTKAEILQRIKDQRDDERTFAFAIRPFNAEELIGVLELDGVVWAHGVCAMSIGIGDRDDWGRGYGYEAARLALAFAFEELNLHRVTVTVFSYNERSRALFRKLGFQHEGTYREFLRRDGERHDMLLFGLLRREWEALKGNTG